MGRATAGWACAFIALHGPGGEDGSMQGALQTLGIPYTGSGVLGSALAMDKQRSKQLWQGIGLATGGFVTLSADTDWQAVIDRFGKVFVKPACEGSSIRYERAQTARVRCRQAFDVASEYAGEVLAEQFIDGPEYTVAVLGDGPCPRFDWKLTTSFMTTRPSTCPTRRAITAQRTGCQEEAEIAALSLRAFQSLGCSVWGRVDLMRDADGASLCWKSIPCPA